MPPSKGWPEENGADVVVEAGDLQRDHHRAVGVGREVIGGVLFCTVAGS